MIKKIESLYLELLKEYYGGNLSQA